MIYARAVSGIILLFTLGGVQAEQVRLSPAEIENLGIRFVQASPAGDIAGIESTARVVLPPNKDAVISALHSGLLTDLAVNVGDEVASGQLLAELRSPEFVSLQREFLDALNEQRLVQLEYERDEQLHSEGIIAARRLQETATRKAIADAALGEHRQLLSFAGMRASDIAALEKNGRLQAALPIRAPFGGVIAERFASAGERLDSMSPVYRLVDTSELWLEINVPQEKLASVRPGARVAVTGAADGCTAVVTTIGQSIDPASQTTIVRAKLDSTAVGCRPGQFIAVRISAEDTGMAGSTVHEVPAAAVSRSGDSSYIFVRTGEGVAAVQVDVLGVNGARVQIRANVGADDLIAASGVSALKSMWAALEEGS